MPQTDAGDKRLKFSISLFIKCQIIVCVHWGGFGAIQRPSKVSEPGQAGPRFPFVIIVQILRNFLASFGEISCLSCPAGSMQLSGLHSEACEISQICNALSLITPFDCRLRFLITKA